MPCLEAAVVQRFLSLLFAVYFDDANLQDWLSMQGSGQTELQRLMALVDSPFADHKGQLMGPQADFLGLTHDADVCRW